MFNVIIVLQSGEIISLIHIKNISWTGARVIFVDRNEIGRIINTGDIKTCDIEREKEG